MSMNPFSAERYIQINTKYRTSPTDNSSDCKVELSKILRRGVYRLVYFLFPNTINTINSTNDKIYIQEEDGEVVECTIEHGFYEYDTIPSAIEDALNTPDGTSNMYEITYSDIKRKMTITSANKNFRILFDNKLNTCHEVMGFNNVDTGYAIDHTSNGLVNLDAIHTLNVSVDGISSVSQKHLHGTSFVVPIPAEVFSYVNYLPDANFEQTIYVHTDKRIISLKLSDEQNNPIDLNGSDWMFIIERIADVDD